MTTDFTKNSGNTRLEQAKAFVLQTYGQRQDGRLLVHNYAGAIAIAELARELSVQEGLSSDQQDKLQIAALFLPLGYLYDYRQPTPYSLELAQQFFQKAQAESPHRKAVTELITEVLSDTPPTSMEGKLLSDAMHAQVYLTDEESKHAQLQLEREFMLSQRYDKAQWAELILEELLRLQFYTHAAQARFQPVLAQTIHQYRAEVEKRRDRAVEAAQPFMELEKKAPVRGVQTYFRSNYRNHINLSAIADNKANIMIGINAILISVLITFLSYRNIGENQPKVLLPIIIFMTSGLASLIFAVLSVRPKVTKLNEETTPITEAKKNITFFGNFINLPVEKYEEAMDEVFSNSNLLYGNMVRDLYYLGKVLDKKYRYLSISYNIFMIGLVATVVSFLIALFI